MLSIGEFSKLCMVTTKTLRHYDLIGLLKPLDLNEENGYRYYGIEQLNLMLKISRLKEYGFSLEEIKSMLEADNVILINTMEQKFIEMEKHLKEEAMNLKRLKIDIANIKKGVFMEQHLQISTIETEPVNIATVRETISIKDFPKLFEKLYAYGIPCEGPPIAIYHCLDFNPEAADIELGFPTSVKNENTRILEGGLCVKGIHYGDYALLHESYLKIGKWIEENKYKIAKPPYEKYINNPDDTPKEKLITEIYFPVEKKV
jgi:DNA-binding transcriptional MerR regulator